MNQSVQTGSSTISPTDNSKLTPLSSVEPVTHVNEIVCKCGCIPKGIPSLFEMAQKRKEYLEKKKAEAEKH